MGIEVDDNCWRIDAKAYYVIKASSQVLQTFVECGQLWRIAGRPVSNTIVVNGYRLTEATIVPEHMEMLRPSGEHIITLIGQGQEFKGIGEVKARRLWEHFGEAIYDVLDKADIAQLEEVLPKPMAQKLVEAWQRFGDTFTLQWLQSKGFAVSMGRKVLDFYGKDAALKIDEDPYRLLSFAATWSVTDALAQGTFGITPTDPRRLAGAVEEVLYAAFDDGHTFLPKGAFARSLQALLGCDDVLDIALREACGRFISQNDRLHAPGPYVMEQGVAESVAIRSASPAYLLDAQELAVLIADYQAAAGISLHNKQVEALELANANTFSIITGGAGTGKTTVLRGLFLICAAAGYTVYPMALSGRAAKRIGEATGHSAETIAGFLNRFDPEDAPEHAVIVIDEASMVDLPSAYRVIRHLPSAYRVVLVGDPHQLPPVGPGLLLHELAHQTSLPVVELSQVKRYGGAIATAAAQIRNGEWPDLSDDSHADIAFMTCSPDQINETVLRLYDEDRNSQILCATRNNVAGGVNAINSLCQSQTNAAGEPLCVWNVEFDQKARTALRVGDPVICLRNRWEDGLQNGSLGVLLSVEPAMPDRESGSSMGRIQWDDGLTRDLTAELLPDLELAYAITIHKAQGSGFRRVIVPVRQSKLLDRTLLYTAVTRAEQQVILVGDVAAAKAAVLAPRHSDRRHVALGALLCEQLERMA
jgi:exodeoxyribonuclease V alpha subunit